MNHLYKFLTTAAIGILLPLGAAAQEAETPEIPRPAITPSENGSYNLTNYPEGLNAIVLSAFKDGAPAQMDPDAGWTINRKAKGYISLYRDDELIRQIPASNRQYIETFALLDEGDYKTDNASVRVTFWESAKNPANVAGTYRVEIPEGFFYYNNDPEALNPAWAYTIKCIGGNSSSLTLSPEPDKGYPKIDKFTLTLPDAEKFRWNESVTTTTIEDLYPPEDVKNLTIKANITYDGLTATITPESPLERVTTYVLTIPSNMAQTQNGSTWASVGQGQYSYRITADAGTTTIQPSTDEVHAFFPASPVKVLVAGYAVERQALFTVTFEKEIAYALMERPSWCPVVNGVPDRDSATKLGGAVNTLVDDPVAPGDRHKYYVLTEDIAGGDFLPSPGEYALIIPTNAVYLRDGEGNYAPNPELIFYYTVGVNPDFKVVLQPADGSAHRDLQHFTIIFDEGTEILCRTSAYAQLSNGIAVYSMNGTVHPDLTNEVTFSLDEPLTEEGTWVFTSPGYGFQANGSPVSISGTYTVDSTIPVDKTCVITPQEGKVEELSEFLISFPAYDGLFGREGNGGITLTRLPDTDIALLPGYYDEEAGAFRLGLDTPTSEPGDYVLHILPNTFWIGGENGFSNDDIERTFTIEEKKDPDQPDQPDPDQPDQPGAVEAIDSDMRSDVYNATGILVLRNADIEAVRALDKGLYIFAGKKIIIK